jgi:hypothetical protein
MKTRKKGRTAKPRSISVGPEFNALLNTRLETLSPMVKGLSHYVQMLVELDAKQDILKAAMQESRNPFAEPCLPLTAMPKIPAEGGITQWHCGGHEFESRRLHHPFAGEQEKRNAANSIVTTVGVTGREKSPKDLNHPADNIPGVVKLGPDVFGLVDKGGVSLVGRRQLKRKHRQYSLAE